MNPVLVILSLFAAAFGSVGLWTFATAFVTRKEDKKTKTVDAAADLETGSVSLRKDLVAERDRAVRRLGIFAAVVIPLLRSVDRFLPKASPCLDNDEITLMRAQTDAVWTVIEPTN